MHQIHKSAWLPPYPKSSSAWLLAVENVEPACFQSLPRRSNYSSCITSAVPLITLAEIMDTISSLTGPFESAFYADESVEGDMRSEGF